MRCILLALPSLACAAQLEVLTLPNWQRVPVGERAVMEGGAMVARVHGPVAGFTNPAGLARLDRPSVSGTVTALEYVRVGAAALGNEKSSDDIQLKPNLVGFASAIDENDLSAGGWSFCLATPTQWSSAIEVRSTTATGSRTDDGRSSLELNCASLAYGRQFSDHLQFGLSLEAWLVDYRYDSGTSAADGTTLLTATYSESGRRLALRSAIGSQYQHGTWRFGAMLRSPGLIIGEQGKISSSSTSGDGTNTTHTAIRDEQVGFAMPLPWSLTCGAAWAPEAVPGFEVEADLAITGGASAGDIFAAASGTVTVIGAAPSSSTIELAPRRLDLRMVYNPRLGLSYRFPNTLADHIVRVHLGGYLEYSPIESSDVYTKLNLLGGTAGLSFDKGPMLLGIGGVYVTSSSISDAVGFITSPGSGLNPDLSDANASFAVRTFVLTISSSYRF